MARAAPDLATAAIARIEAASADSSARLCAGRLDWPLPSNRPAAHFAHPTGRPPAKVNPPPPHERLLIVRLCQLSRQPVDVRSWPLIARSPSPRTRLERPRRRWPGNESWQSRSRRRHADRDRKISPKQSKAIGLVLGGGGGCNFLESALSRVGHSIGRFGKKKLSFRRANLRSSQAADCCRRRQLERFEQTSAPPPHSAAFKVVNFSPSSL